MTETDNSSLDYFWSTKRDFSAWVGFEEWQHANPKEAQELQVLLDKWKEAEQAITSYIGWLLEMEKP